MPLSPKTQTQVPSHPFFLLPKELLKKSFSSPQLKSVWWMKSGRTQKKLSNPAGCYNALNYQTGHTEQIFLLWGWQGPQLSWKDSRKRRVPDAPAVLPAMYPSRPSAHVQISSQDLWLRMLLHLNLALFWCSSCSTVNEKCSWSSAGVYKLQLTVPSTVQRRSNM